MKNFFVTLLILISSSPVFAKTVVCANNDVAEVFVLNCHTVRMAGERIEFATCSKSSVLKDTLVQTFIRDNGGAHSLEQIETQRPGDALRKIEGPGIRRSNMLCLLATKI